VHNSVTKFQTTVSSIIMTAATYRKLKEKLSKTKKYL